jgi:HAD superfamily hydrolase (TIGR01509 family)
MGPMPSAGTPPRGVLLDAYGTLVRLEPPAPRLAAALARDHGVEVSAAEAGAAFAAEVGYYKAHHLEGRDEASLAKLRERCAGVLLAALPPRVRDGLAAADLVPALLESIRFVPFPETIAVLRELRAAGLRLAVVSNWDVSLGEVLERIGVGEQLDAVVTSAAVGVAKPDPAPFRRALELLELEPAEALHVGDSPELDLPGAAAAGVAAILVERDGAAAPPGVAAISSLRQLRAIAGL